MPILAGIPVLANPFEADLTYSDSRTISFRALDGSDILPFTGREFLGQPGMTGLDFAPVDMDESSIAGMVGTVIDNIRYSPRDIFIPQYVRSDYGHVPFLGLRDRIDALFKFSDVDYRSLAGTFDLVTSSARGERSLRCVYVGGVEGDLVRGTSSIAESMGIKLRAVQPLYVGTPWVTPPIRRAAPQKFFGRFPPRLAATQQTLSGVIRIWIGGDEPPWPQIDVLGPCDSAAINADGLSFTIPDGLDDGETATIVTDPRGRTALFNGAKDWSRIGPADVYNPLAPGIQEISLDLENPSATSQAYVSGPSLYRRPW